MTAQEISQVKEWVENEVYRTREPCDSYRVYWASDKAERLYDMSPPYNPNDWSHTLAAAVRLHTLHEILVSLGHWAGSGDYGLVVAHSPKSGIVNYTYHIYRKVQP